MHAVRTFAPVRPALDATDRAILESSHMTAHVDTASGSRYTAVARNGVVTLIHDTDGWVRQGTHLHVIGGRLYLRDNAKDVTVVCTTRITGCYILSN